jgi:hypothetical protein
MLTTNVHNHLDNILHDNKIRFGRFLLFHQFFFYNNNFFKVIEKTEQTLSAENFFKTLIDLSRFLGYVFIWVFPDFLDTPF